MSNRTVAAPEKLPAEAIFALLDGAPFGRLTTYAPPAAGRAGRCYVVPLQFLHRAGAIYLITTPGRKLSNLRAAPRGVCFQLDLSEGAGWTSVCAWGDYSDVPELRERIGVLSASFGKYPERTSRQAAAWLRQRTPRLGAQEAAASRDLAIGRLTLSSVSGRSWPGLLLTARADLVHPAARPGAARPRQRPLRLDRAACWEVLGARPLARVGCYHPAKERTYCLPLWYVIEGPNLWFYHPGGGRAFADALAAHPQGVCVQVDNLDCSPAADPGQPWRSVVAEGTAQVFPLGAATTVLPEERQRALLHAIRARLLAFGIDSVFVPPDPDVVPPQGLLICVRVLLLAGQATGDPT